MLVSHPKRTIHFYKVTLKRGKYKYIAEGNAEEILCHRSESCKGCKGDLRFKA